MKKRFKKVLVAGGAGYVGSVLVPKLLGEGYQVRILDLYIYGDTLSAVSGHPRLEQVKGDIRNAGLLREVMNGCDAVIHLSCISNDPSVDLDPALSRTINYESFEPFVRISKEKGVSRFIFASSGSVYGVSEAENVTEEHPLIPVSLYNKYKAMCEPTLLNYQSKDFIPVIVRPATICGCSPRQRLDLTVNLLTAQGLAKGEITVFGGKQMRPNLHIRDMTDLYLRLLEYPDSLISGEIFNVAYQNHTVAEIAIMVKSVVEQELPGRREVGIVTTPSNDIRSYHLSSEKLKTRLNFTPILRIEDAVRDLVAAYQSGKLSNSLTDDRYYNIKKMKNINFR